MRLLVERKGACVVQKSCRCTRCALLCVIAVAGPVGAVPTRRAATSEGRQSYWMLVARLCCRTMLDRHVIRDRERREKIREVLKKRDHADERSRHGETPHRIYSHRLLFAPRKIRSSRRVSRLVHEKM